MCVLHMLLVPSSFHLQYPQTKSCWNGVNLSMNLGPCLVVFDIKRMESTHKLSLRAKTRLYP